MTTVPRSGQRHWHLRAFTEARDHSEIAGPHSCDYSARVNRVTGTYRNGKVALDQPVDWPEGTNVVCEYGAQPEGVDFSFDGSPWEDTPEAIQKWVEWFDSLEPVLTSQELERFQSELRSARDQQKALLPKWQERINPTFKSPPSL